MTKHPFSRYWAHHLSEVTRRPDVEDFRSVLTFSRPAMLVVFAPMVTAYFTVSSTGPHVTIWFWASALLCTVLYLSARQFDVSRFSRITDKFRNLITVFATLAALPWVALPWVIEFAPNTTQFDTFFGTIACGAVSWGGVFMISRVMQVSLTFSAVIIVSVIAELLFSYGSGGESLIPWVLMTHVVLTMFGINSAVVGRQRDRAFRKLEVSKKAAIKVAYTDPVTGLANRTAFNRDLVAFQENALESDCGFTLAIMDLDLFKNINDAHGHHMGDQVLQGTAQRIADALPEDWRFYRMGGDEFAIIAPRRCVGSHEGALLGIAASMSQPILLDSLRLEMSATIGFACFPDDTANGESVLNAAEIALRDAKASLVGRVRCFDPTLAQAHMEALLIEADIRRNIAANLIEIYYQPQICFETGALKGVEALCRLKAKDGTNLNTQTVFDVAELRGLSQSLSRSVFSKVGAQLPVIFANCGDVATVSINICPADLVTGSALLDVLRQWKEDGVPTDRVRIELTEECVVGRGSIGAKNFLNAITALGYKLSLDDFGTGHASLATLRTLQIDELKVDKQFVDNIDDKKNVAILSGIIGIAESMGITCVIEGVETEAQYWQLNLMNAQVGQGYYWSKPLSFDDLNARLSEGDISQQSTGLSVNHARRS